MVTEGVAVNEQPVVPISEQQVENEQEQLELGEYDASISHKSEC